MCPDFSPAPSPARPPASPPATPLSTPRAAALAAPPGKQRWHIYCQVVDNLGDVGVCWRLASALSGSGQEVHLVIDDPRALQWLAAGAKAEVQVHTWPGPDALGDVVIEAFGCTMPQTVLQALARRGTPQQQDQPPTGSVAATTSPIWLNLEYLSAEPYVEASHGLLSPQRQGPPKWFFYPGFSQRTGGLLREPDLPARQSRFDRLAWLQGLGLKLRPDDQLVSLFCYANDHLPALLASLADSAQGGGQTLLLATAALPPGAQQMLIAAANLHPALRVHQLPLLSQIEFDHLLWASDLNVVRGEDSLVRALWAAKPFVWQAYVQHDQAHHAKVLAMLDFLDSLHGPDADRQQMAAVWRAWNGLPGCRWPGLPSRQDGLSWQIWRDSSLLQRDRLGQQSDLLCRLLAFVASKQQRPEEHPAPAANASLTTQTRLETRNALLE